MENIITLQASKSLEIIKVELQNNSQSTALFIQVQHIRQHSKQYLDLLADHLKSYQHYHDVSIKITKNTLIDNEGYQIIAQCLQYLTKIQTLKLFLEQSCLVGSQGILYLSQSISTLKQLSDLTIFIDDYNYVRNEGFIYLASIFSQLPNLIKIQIKIGQSNRYDDLGIIDFCENLSLIKQLKHLKLDVDAREISKVGVQAIAKSLEQLTNLESLDFIIDSTLGQIEGAKELVTSLEGFQNFQDEQTIACFAEIFSLQPQLTNLSLEIDCSKLYGKYTALCLANSLKNLINLTNLKIIVCRDSNIGDQGCSALAQVVKNMKNLKQLLISIDNNNKIGNEGAFNLGEALGELKQLESLYLNIGYQNEIFLEGARAIAEGIQKMLNLINLDVSISRTNQIKQIEVFSFGQILSQISNLENLKYCFNSNITNLGVQGFAKGFQCLKKLKKLQLTFSISDNLTEENQISFFESFKNLTNLNSLKLQFTGNIYASKINIFHLSKSLAFLENLTELYLYVNINQDNNQNIIDFGKALGCLTKIVKLELIMESTQYQFQQQQSLYFESIALGIRNLTQIQDLRMLIFNKEFNQNESQLFEDIFKKLINLKKLSFFRISNGLIENLANSLQYLSNLEYLNLDFEFYGGVSQKLDQDLILFGKALSYLTNLNEISLNIYLPLITKEGIDQVIYGIKSIKNIEKIDTTIRNANSQIIGFLDCTSSFESLQIFDLTLGQYFGKTNKINIPENEKMENQIQHKIQLQNQQNINPLSLTQLSISIDNIEDSITEKLDDFLRNILNYRNIIKFYLSIGDCELFTIQSFQLMSDSLSNLQYLQDLTLNFYENNVFGPQSARCLANAFKNLPELEQLSLDIGSFNYINEDGSHYLAQGIKSLINLRKLTFKLRGCNIQKQGAIKIGDCLQHLTSLVIFHLQIGQDKIESEGANWIGKAIKYLSNLNQLTIQIGQQNQIKKIGACALGDGMQYLTNLNSLDLAINESNNIESCGISAICKAFSKMNYLKFLNLDFGEDNQIKSSSIQEISEAIKFLDHMRLFKITINISEFTSNYVNERVNMIRLIGQEGCSKLADSMKQLQSLEGLKINFNYHQIGSGLLQFGKSLSQLTNLKHLSLGLQRKNNITGYYIQQLGKYLCQLQNLEKILLKINIYDEFVVNTPPIYSLFITNQERLNQGKKKITSLLEMKKMILSLENCVNLTSLTLHLNQF
ncbi:hypothetical protein ABPG72_020524 [Tetrahymena utriculariae]